MDALTVTAEVLAKEAGVSTRTVWRDVKRGLLPHPIPDGSAAARWMACDVEPWLALRQGRPVDERSLAGFQGAAQRRPAPETATVEELARMTDISERLIWRMVASGDFPQPLPKPLRPRLWRTADVVGWMEARKG